MQKNSKWIKDLNVRPESIKLLEENIGKTLSDINHSKILYNQPPIMLERKAVRGMCVCLHVRERERQKDTEEEKEIYSRGKHKQNTLRHKSQQDIL